MPTAPPRHRPPGQHERPAAQALYDQERGTPDERGYDTRWRKFRAFYLTRNPLCADCQAENRLTAAREVHHIVKVRDDPARRLDPANVLGLCTPCHSRRTQRGE